MEILFVQDSNYRSVINIDNNVVNGYSFFNNGDIIPVNDKSFEVFKMFIISNNNTKIDNEDGYEVYLDNETDFKHYFKDGVEDYFMFFNNNGIIADVYNNDNQSHYYDYDVPKVFTDKKDNNKKVTTNIKALIAILLVGVSLGLTTVAVDNMIKLNSPKYKVESYANVNYTLEDIRNRIYSSNSLTGEEKDFLYNEDFFNMALPYINNSDYAKYLLNIRLDNITIKTYDHNTRSATGFYRPSEPNNLNLSDVSIVTSKEDNLSHEFIHMCQADFNYRVLREACAEILSEEFYGATATSYYRERIILKRLVETIGPEPILIFNFTGDFSAIEREIRPYLSDYEYDNFLDSLQLENFDSPNYDENEATEKLNVCNATVNTLYYRKYGVPIETDKAVLNIGNHHMVRYYFNKNMMDKEHSYIDGKISEYYSIKEAYEKGMIDIIVQHDGPTTRFLSYGDIKSGAYEDDDSFECISSYNRPVQIGVNADGDLYAYIEGESKREYLPTIAEKFPTDVSKTKRLD